MFSMKVCKYIVYTLLLVFQFWLFWNIKLDPARTDNLLILLTSATSITVAILTTYFISKLFTEKQERIQRKMIIDDYSQMVTALRRISFFIRSDHSFWNQFSDIKKTLDSDNYKGLSIETFRKADCEQYSQYKEEFDVEVAQAYLALKGLENNEPSSFEFYRSFKNQNYSSDELIRFKEYCSHIWCFLDDKKTILNSFEFQKEIQEEYFFITKKHSPDNSLIKDITALFTKFSEKILHQHHYYTKLNESKMPIQFYWISINLITYLLLTLATLMTYILPVNQDNKSFITLIFLSLFSANTIDLIIGLFSSVKKELTITDFYKI